MTGLTGKVATVMGGGSGLGERNTGRPSSHVTRSATGGYYLIDGRYTAV